MANIRTARRSGLVLRGGRMRRETLWGDIAPGTVAMAAASTAVITNVTGALFLGLRPFTVVRVRAQIQVRSDQQGAIEFWQAAWGICVVSDQAVAIGVTAIPTPFTDLGSDLWFAHEMATGLQGISSGTSTGELGRMVNVDSKAMRKVEEGSQLVFVAETSAGSNGVSLTSAGRVLIKLH